MWALMQYDWCSYRKGNFKCTQREDDVQTKEENSQLQAKGRDLKQIHPPQPSEEPTQPTLSSQASGLQNWENIYMLF